MEEDLYERIGEGDLNPTYKDGQVYQHTDINNMLSILKTAVNENYYDIQRLGNGSKPVGKANSLDGAALSRYLIETLQADDDKIPSSQQVKAYVDALFATYSPPIRGVDYWTEEDQQQIADEVPAIVEQQIEDMGPLGFNLTGNYDDTITYHKFDVVYYQGSTYAAKIDTIGNLPTNSVYWDILAIGTLKQFTYNNVAEMKVDNSLEDGMFVETAGYYEANDGGGAAYKIRTKTNEDVIDESTIIALYDNSLVAELIINNKYINAEVFGLKDNDSTFDNMNKLKSIINGILKNKDITILFKNSTYYFSSCITIQQNALLEGNNTTFMFTNIDKSTIFDTVDDQTEKVFKFKGINIEYNSKLSGENETFTESNLIRLFNIKNGLIENCNFNNNITGNVINNLLIRDNSKNIKINNCIFTENIGNLVGGNIWIWNYSNNIIKNIEITNCIFNSNTKDETLACYGTNGNGTIKNVIIENCIFNSSSSNKIVEINFKAHTTNVIFNNNEINYEGNIGSYISITENADLIDIKNSKFIYNYNNINNNKYISASSTGKINIISNKFVSLQNRIYDVYNIGTSSNVLFENNNVSLCKYCGRVLTSANGTINTMTNNNINFETSVMVINQSSNKNYCYIRNNNLSTTASEATILYYAGNQYSINEIINNKITATTLLNLIKGAGYINYWIINNIISCTNLNILLRESDTVGITPTTSIIYDNNITGTLNDLVNINTSATNRDFRNNLVNNVDVTFVTSSPADSNYSLLFRRLVPQYFIFNAKSSSVLGYKKQGDNNVYTTINIS